MVHSVSVELPATKDFLDRVRTATQKDQELQLLTQQVKLGWPKKISEVDDTIKCYWSFREDITIAEDILVKGHRIIVPKAMREYMLKQVHEGHFGMDKCKMHMSNCCYWPNVNKEIEEMIRNCPTCLEFAPAKPKIKRKDMLHHEVPSTPWTKLATDIFHFQGTNYLILVDYTSKFPVVKQLRKIDQRVVTTALEEIFTERGYPDELVSDNGPCYRGEQFAEFLRKKGIKHMTSSPYYPQSNGLAEAYVKVVKNMMKKALKCKVRFNDMLYQYRTSPVAGKKESPIELLEQWRPRTNVPYLGKGDLRIKPTPFHKDPKANSHSYPIGTSVMHCAPPEPGYYTVWYPAKIKSLLKEPKAYLLENKEGKMFRRTEQHLCPYNTPCRKEENPSTPPLARSIDPPMLAVNARGYITAHQQRTEIMDLTDDYGQTTRRNQKKKHGIPRENTTTDRWQKRNLRPTPSPVARCSRNLRLTPSPTTSSQHTSDSEPRRSSRIQARKSLSDTD